MFYQHYQDKTDYFKIGTGACRDHFHRVIEIIYCIKNDKPLYINGKKLLLREGEIVFIPPLAVHSAPKIETQKSLCVIMPIAYSDIFNHHTTGRQVKSHIISDEAVAKDIFEHLMQLENCNDALLKQGIYTYVLAKILKNLEFCVKEKGDETNFSAAILEYIELHYAEKLTQESLAKEFGYNRNYFSSLFKKNIHTSFSSYLNVVRINKAIPLLENYSVTATAEKVGFASVQSFLQNFKKITGKTPREYIKRK